jgi:FixJ family two-component response regulator
MALSCDSRYGRGIPDAGRRDPCRSVLEALRGDMPKAQIVSIVDDDPYARGSIQDLVESLGYATASFDSAEGFLQSGRAAETACLISDIQMSGLSGLDLQDRLRAEGRPVPVIFVTAFPEKFRARAGEGAVVGFLSKPFREQSLIDLLKIAVTDFP